MNFGCEKVDLGEKIILVSLSHSSGQLSSRAQIACHGCDGSHACNAAEGAFATLVLVSEVNLGSCFVAPKQRVQQ